MASERETVIRRDDDGWHAWSDRPGDIAKFTKQGWTLVKSDRYGSYFDAPAHAVTIGKAEKAARKPMSEEQKQVLRERMRKLHEQQASSV